MNICISTYATQRYDYALPSVGRRIASAIYNASLPTGDFIFVGDKSAKIKECAYKYIDDALPEGWRFHYLALDLNDNGLKNYKENAQLLIAQMQGSAFTLARKLNLDYFWSVESDVLVSPNSLQVSLDILNFDSNYYDVCMCSYPSQGGGSFLGGRGTHQKAIEDDFTEDEKELPDEIREELKARQEELDQEDFNPTEEWMQRGGELGKIVREAPPLQNVFAANAKKWKQRGWMEYAYPAIGKGAILPTDWVGLGCTLLSKKALAYAHFDGYTGGGTQDLYLGWNFWKPNDINMCVTTHSICDHIIRKRINGTEEQSWDEFIHVQAYHEPEGECIGHLRQTHKPFYTHIAGEKFREEVNPEEKKETVSAKRKRKKHNI